MVVITNPVVSARRPKVVPRVAPWAPTGLLKVQGAERREGTSKAQAWPATGRRLALLPVRHTTPMPAALRCWLHTQQYGLWPEGDWTPTWRPPGQSTARGGGPALGASQPAGPHRLRAGSLHRDHQLRHCPTRLLKEWMLGPHEAGGWSPTLTRRSGWWAEPGAGSALMMI